MIKGFMLNAFKILSSCFLSSSFHCVAFKHAALYVHNLSLTLELQVNLATPNSTLTNHPPQCLHPTLRQRYQVRRNALEISEFTKKKMLKSNSTGLAKWGCLQYGTLCLDMTLEFSEYLTDSLLL